MDFPQNCLKTEQLTEHEGILFTQKEAADISYIDASHDVFFDIEEKSYWFRHRNDIIAAGIAHNPPEDGQIIDVGGGNGNTASFLARQGYQVAMFEPGKSGVFNAKKRGVPHVVCGLFDDQCVREGSVKSVGLFDVLEHIEDDRGFLGDIRRMLDARGMLYLTVPAHQALWSQSDTSGHFRRYALPALRSLVAESGFDVLQASYFFWFLPVPIFLFRSLPYRFGGEKKSFSQADNKKKKEREFVMPGFADKVLSGMLSMERKRIGEGKRMPVGASIFLAARKRA